MDKIIIAMVVVGGLGAIIGALLAIAAKVLYVKVDNRITEIYDLLPHFNCGSCGTAGCQAFAEKLVNGEIAVDKCRPMKPDAKERVSNKLDEFKNL